MKKFLMHTFQTDQISSVELEELKKAINGEHMIKRLQYRKTVGNLLLGKKPVVKKGEVFRQESSFAAKLDASQKNELFGFHCLHYTVSESSKFLMIKVLNKTNSRMRVGIRTVELPEGAKAVKDFGPIDKVLIFNGESH